MDIVLLTLRRVLGRVVRVVARVRVSVSCVPPMIVVTAFR